MVAILSNPEPRHAAGRPLHPVRFRQFLEDLRDDGPDKLLFGRKGLRFLLRGGPLPRFGRRRGSAEGRSLQEILPEILDVPLAVGEPLAVDEVQRAQVLGDDVSAVSPAPERSAGKSPVVPPTPPSDDAVLTSTRIAGFRSANP
jgi:hypothetical protein